jgi:trans-aconitate methyltransferase
MASSYSWTFDNIGMKYEEAFGQSRDQIDFVNSALGFLLPNSFLLDIGCGTGKPTASIVVANGHQLHGIDHSSVMIALSRKQVPGGSFEQANILTYQPSDTFDAVLSTFSLLTFPHQDMVQIMANIHSWIKPRGYFFLATLDPNIYSVTTEPTPVNDNGSRKIETKFMGRVNPLLLYNESGWDRLLTDAGFEIITTSKSWYSPAPEFECDAELQYYITARRTT